MANFLKKHGPQDPFTRAYLDPASIVNNITLKILVRNNPNLPRWIKYEESATRIWFWFMEKYYSIYQSLMSNKTLDKSRNVLQAF